jgi:actin-related protein 5
MECEGLNEVLDHVLSYFDSSYRQKLMDFVLLSGGNTLLPNFDLRIKRELTMLNPVGT